MAITNAVGTAGYIFRTQYGALSDAVLRDHPFLHQIQKGSKATGHDGEFVGSDFQYAIKFGYGQGVSGTFANSQAQASASRGVKFSATAALKYGTVLVAGPAILACKDDGAFVDLVTTTTDETIKEHTSRLAFDIYRGTSGIRGKRASAATNVITLATPDDCRNFEIDMTIGASQNADGSSPRTGTTTITGVSLSAGTITVASAAAITTFSDNDFLFVAGDVGTCMQGMEVATPLVAPTAGDSFRGQDRSVYVERLAGGRLTTLVSQNQTIEENCGLAAINVNANGGKCTDVTMNPINFYAVQRRGNARVEMVMAGGDLVYGFETIKIVTAAGALTCWSDPDCPIDRVRGYNHDSHYIRRAGDFVHVIQDDGNGSLRSTTADSIETRTRSYGNYIQNQTRDHFVFAP